MSHESPQLTGSSLAVALAKVTGKQSPLSHDDVKNPDSLAVVAVKYAARRLDDLAVTRAAKLALLKECLKEWNDKADTERLAAPERSRITPASMPAFAMT